MDHWMENYCEEENNLLAYNVQVYARQITTATMA